MKLDIISYEDLCHKKNNAALQYALLMKGIVGVKDVPQFENKTRAYIEAAREFSALPEEIKKQYAPNRKIGDTEGYELGAEHFKNEKGEWQIDDKKTSYYAYVPDDPRNKWPREVDLKTPYLALGELIFETGKLVLQALGLNESVGLHHHTLSGYGRMLHYLKESALTDVNPDWCGAHYDHGVFTGLVPAYYFHQGQEVEEPAGAGLFIVPSNGNTFEKIEASDKSILLFQVGEFGQIISNDKIKATKHIVKKAMGQIERYAFALFNNAKDDYKVKSSSVLTKDSRYANHQSPDGSITYGDWHRASFERYLAGEKG